jgi:hypothetical protein
MTKKCLYKPNKNHPKKNASKGVVQNKTFLTFATHFQKAFCNGLSLLNS